MNLRLTRTTPAISQPTVRVRLVVEDGTISERTFSGPFSIGRDETCDVQIDSGLASRRHAEVVFDDGRWTLRDLESTNGTYLDETRVEKVALGGHTEVRLGKDGPRIAFDVEDPPPDAAGGVPRQIRPSYQNPPSETAPTPARRPAGISRHAAHPQQPADDPAIEDYVAKYFGEGAGPAGEHTQMIRRAYASVQERHRRKYLRLAIAGAAIVFLLIVYAGWQHVQVSRLERRAGEAFATMKQLDVEAARLQHYIEERGDASLNEQLTELAALRIRMRLQYEGYVEELGIRRRLNQEEIEIYRVARIFNESEFEMPATFVRAVRRTIQEYWLTGPGRGRFERAVTRAGQEGYTESIVGSLMRHGLPPEFFYLALQESNFDPAAVGPSTRWGIAKGMWQFIPETARAYGLVVGPREGQRTFDPLDDRHDPAAATDAAARYLLEIYAQLAQASGLLAMASYNWGEHRVVDRLHQLMEGIPDDPEARSYWRFLTEYSSRMPEETKDYVLKIFSAAVIGQNPRLYGFSFDNPLQSHIEAVTSSADPG